MNGKIVWIIASVFLGVVIGFAAAYLILNGGLNMKESKYIIGKSFNFVVRTNEEIDANALRQMVDAAQNHPLNLLNQSDVEKLIEFMRRNSLLIAPGNYVLNQGDDFGLLLEKLRFQGLDIGI